MSIVKVDAAKLQNDYDGFELYYDKVNSVLFSSTNCVARWVDCSPTTIKNASVKLGVGKVAEIHTQQGLRMGNLYTSTEVVEILNELSTNNRVKKQTRENAQSRINLLATLGNELGGMLAVAPEELAKKAINHTTTLEQVEEIDNHIQLDRQYKKVYKVLHAELDTRGADGIHHATVNKHNNKLVGVPDGGRPYMDNDQKTKMTIYQLAENLKLEKTSTANPWQAVNVCKVAGNYMFEALDGLLNPQMLEGF